MIGIPVIGLGLIIALMAVMKNGLGFRDEDGRHLGGTNHIALLNHPAVYEQLRQWLSVSPEPEVPALPAPAPG